jgi:uncharacterized protein YgiM (DUF1202 family)
MDESEEFQKFTASLIAGEQPAPQETPAPEASEAAPTEAKPEDKPAAAKPEEKKPEDKPVDWKALADKEKERRIQKAQARVQQQKIERELTEAKAKAAQLDEIMKLSKEKRLAALEKLGMTLDDVNSEYIREHEENPNKPPPHVAALEKQLADMKEKLDAVLQKDEQAKAEREEQASKAQREAIQKTYESKASEVIKANQDEYEILAKNPQGSEVVFHYIAAHYANTAKFDDDGNVLVPGEELEISEACRQVEAKLAERYGWVREVKKLRGALKIPDSTTLAGDVRTPAPAPEQVADEDKEFLNATLRLIKQQPA